MVPQNWNLESKDGLLIMQLPEPNSRWHFCRILEGITGIKHFVLKKVDKKEISTVLINWDMMNKTGNTGFKWSDRRLSIFWEFLFWMLHVYINMKLLLRFSLLSRLKIHKISKFILAWHFFGNHPLKCVIIIVIPKPNDWLYQKESFQKKSGLKI